MSRGSDAGSAIGAIWRAQDMDRWRTVDRVRVDELLESILAQPDVNNNHSQARELVNYLDARARSFWYDSLIELKSRTRLISSLLMAIEQNDLQSEMDLLEENSIKSLKGLTRQKLYDILVKRREYLVENGMRALTEISQAAHTHSQASGSPGRGPGAGFA